MWQSTLVSGAKRADRRRWLAAALHPTWPVRTVALVLLLLPWVWALALVLRHVHLDSGAVGILFTVSLGLPALVLGWAGYQAATKPAEVTGLTMAQVTDQLALAIGAQWEAEAAVRRFNEPYPLPVSWGAADASLTDAWDSLVKLATGGAGWPPPPPAGTWAAGPGGLAGTGGDLVKVLERVPTGRLVVLGEPGAGKTMLMVRLVLDLLARRQPGDPVPILAPLASWNPEDQDLKGWLAAQLVVNYPALSAPPPAGWDKPTQAEALLASGKILPILDGLDEIPDRLRSPAISWINDAMRPGEPLVVTCRSQQYRAAIRPRRGVEVTLRAAAVRLRPLGADAVRGYLCDDAAGPVAKARWAPVFAALGTKAPVGRALRTPLMVGLARAIYNPRPDELAGALRDPAELCKPNLANRKAVESLLFDAFIPAAYRQSPPDRRKAQNAEKWLVFLADHLERKIGLPDLAWWQLPMAVPDFARWFGVVIGVATGVVGGVLTGIGIGVVGAVKFGTVTGVESGAVTGVLAFAGFGLMARAGSSAAVRTRRAPEPARDIRWRRPSRSMVVTAAASGAGAGLAFGVLAGVVFGAVPGIVAGVMAGFAGFVFTGIGAWSGAHENPPLDVRSAVSPQAVLARDRRSAVVRGIVTGVMFGAVAGVVFGGAAGALLGADVGAVFGAVAATAMGFAVGLGASFVAAASPHYGAARIWLARHHQLPWQLMDFLADAHTRGVLRQAGAVYQFRHIELQHRLATRPSGQGAPG